MSNLRALSHRTALLLLGSALAGATGCFGKGMAGTSQPTVILLANNRGFYDVNVYAVRSGQTAGRRLGTVTGNSTTTLKVPVSELQPGNMLVVQVRSVGGRYTWYSPAVQMGSGIVARLDVVQTANGSLGQSQMYSQVAPQ
jgi:hypothetical protein